VPGQRYGDQWCGRIIYEVDLHETSLVPFPYDPRCYRTELLRSRSEVERAYGGPMPAEIVPTCTHCTECDGADHGPSAEDIDQQLWNSNGL
jgi:hypothetical protein